MAWTTPPTFADGNILSAAQLNILSDDVEHLYGALSGVNVPFRSVSSGSDVPQNTQIWKMRRVGRYLHYKVRITSGTHDTLRLYYNGTEFMIDDGSQAAPHTWQSYIDTNSLGLTVGQFYDVSWRFAFNAAGGVTLDYLLESDSTSIEEWTMAYTRPKQWTHGDIPTAAEMNKYSGDLNHIYGLQPTLVGWPVERAPGSENWYLQHRYRWLAYDDNGTIEDPSGIGATVTLSEPGSGVYFYDLDSIDWLTPGAIIRLTGFDWVIEVDVPS